MVSKCIRRKELMSTKIDIYKPRGLIIIGRTQNKAERNRLRSVASYVVNMDVVSYDMLIKKAEVFISHLKRG
ncbi:MAG: Shedu anti-phage system protein SduA domain-containing protein, partial [Thermoproteota archaeon]